MELRHQEGLAFEANGATGHSAEIEIGRKLSALINRVSGASVSEIGVLIAELEALRDFLLSEGQRIQRDVTEYARLNQSAINSTKVITEALLRWKAGNYSGPQTR
jgi:hypothetical protein